MRPARTLHLVTLLVASVLFAVSCGGTSQDDGPEMESTMTETTGEAESEVVVVKMAGLAFEPARIGLG